MPTTLEPEETYIGARIIKMMDPDPESREFFPFPNLGTNTFMPHWRGPPPNPFMAHAVALCLTEDGDILVKNVETVVKTLYNTWVDVSGFDILNWGMTMVQTLFFYEMKGIRTVLRDLETIDRLFTADGGFVAFRSKSPNADKIEEDARGRYAEFIKQPWKEVEALAELIILLLGWLGYETLQEAKKALVGRVDSRKFDMGWQYLTSAIAESARECREQNDEKYDEESEIDKSGVHRVMIGGINELRYPGVYEDYEMYEQEYVMTPVQEWAKQFEFSEREQYRIGKALVWGGANNYRWAYEVTEAFEEVVDSERFMIQDQIKYIDYFKEAAEREGEKWQVGVQAAHYIKKIIENHIHGSGKDLDAFPAWETHFVPVEKKPTAAQKTDADKDNQNVLIIFAAVAVIAYLAF